MRPVAPDPELIRWLWSPAGLTWSQNNFQTVRHSTGCFAVIKDDHECGPLGVLCGVMGGSSYVDMQIRGELRRYGISGVPREWKRQQERLNRAGQTD